MKIEDADVMPYTDEFQYNDLAERYKDKKKASIINIIQCGELIVKAKQFLEKGEFHKWLKDSRVGESIKTSQRLMRIFTYYRHLLDKQDHDFGMIDKIGMVKMLELTQLPTIFKKTIDIENDSGHTEKVEVMDEDKVTSLLNKGVSMEGKVKQVKDLPLKQFKEIIKEESGEYTEPEGDVTIESEGDSSDTQSSIPIDVSLQAISDLSLKCQDVTNDLARYDLAGLGELPEDVKQELIGSLKQAKSHLTAVIVKINDVVGA